jgi:hypothetical protein
MNVPVYFAEDAALPENSDVVNLTGPLFQS